MYTEKRTNLKYKFKCTQKEHIDYTTTFLRKHSIAITAEVSLPYPVQY